MSRTQGGLPGLPEDRLKAAPCPKEEKNEAASYKSSHGDAAQLWAKYRCIWFCF